MKFSHAFDGRKNKGFSKFVPNLSQAVFHQKVTKFLKKTSKFFDIKTQVWHTLASHIQRRDVASQQSSIFRNLHI